MQRLIGPILSILALVFTLAACGGGDDGVDPTPDPAQGTYTGVLVTEDGLEATLEITLAAGASARTTLDVGDRRSERHGHALPVTGTATVNLPVGTATITGSYDPHTMVLTASIATLGMTIDAGFDGTRITGSITISGSPPRTIPIDFMPTRGTSVTAYCGDFTSARRGTITVLVASSLGLAGGAFVATDGQAPYGSIVVGTVTGATVNLTTPAGAAVTTGTITGDMMTGPWSHGGASGTFTSALSPCPRPPPAATITSVGISASRLTVPSAETATLTATVLGTGPFSPAVTWSLVGSGTLSAPAGSTVTYTAPTVTATTTVTVTATSAADVTRSDTATLTITPAGTAALGPLSTVAGGGASHAIRTTGTGGTGGTLWAWGSNMFGMLGTGEPDTATHTTPVQIGTATDWVSVVGGVFFRLALKRDGTVWAWGFEQDGELGDGGTANSTVTTPTQIPGLTGVISIGAGDFHAFAIRSDRTLWAWGANHQFQCGRTTPASVLTPMQVMGITDVLAVTGGNSHSLAIARDSQVIAKVWSFGSNFERELTGTGGHRATPEAVAALGNVTQIAAGINVSAAIAGGTLFTWGSGNNFHIGGGSNPQTIPFNTGINDATGLAISTYETFVMRSTGELWGAGANLYGYLNGMAGTIRPTFVHVTAATGIRHVLSTGQRVHLLAPNRSLSVLGDGTTTEVATDVRLPDDPNP